MQDRGYVLPIIHLLKLSTACCIDTDLLAGQRNVGQAARFLISRSRMCIMRCGSRSLKPAVKSLASLKTNA